MHYPLRFCCQRLLLLLLVSLFLLTFLGWSMGRTTPALQAADEGPARADLVISSVMLTPPSSGAADETNVVIVVKNQGAATAKEFSMLLYVDPAQQPPVSSTLTTTQVFYGLELQAGGVITWTRTNHKIPHPQPRIYAWVDPVWENKVAEANEQNNLFPHPNAAIITLQPNYAQTGASGRVTVTATATHFLPGLTTADFGEGVTISNVTVLSATQLIAQLGVATDTVAGARSVTITTGVEMITRTATGAAAHFTITRPGPPPAITHVQPAAGNPGANLTVTIAATNTHFVIGRTDADFGPGITIDNVTVISPTHAVVALTIAPNAAPGERAVTMTTGTEVVKLERGFRVHVIANGGATLYIDPSPARMVVSETHILNVVVAPEAKVINGVQIHGRVDPAYLRLVNLMTGTGSLGQVLEPLHFDPATGVFRYSAGALGQTTETPFTLFRLEVQARQKTGEDGVTIEFLKTFPSTDITGPGGASVLGAVRNGVVIITDAPTTATLHGRIDLQGRPPKPAAAWAIPLRLELITPDQSAIHPYLVTTDNRGDFWLQNLPLGDYYLRIKGDHTLANQVRQVTLKPGLNEIYLGTLLEGDVETNNSGNRVVQMDFGLLSRAFGKCSGDEGYLPNADLNEIDDCVTIEDLGLLTANYNQQGDIVYPTPDIPAPIAPSQRLATLAFAHSQAVITIGQRITLPLFVDPQGGDAISGVTVQYAFDPQVVEIAAVDLAGNPFPMVLTLAIDNSQGALRLSYAALPGQSVPERAQIASVQVKLKTSTAGVELRPLFAGPYGTAIVGANGSLLAHAAGVLLISADRYQPQNERLFLPLVARR